MSPRPQAGIKLRPAQLDALADLYKEADGRVNYRRGVLHPPPPTPPAYESPSLACVPYLRCAVPPRMASTRRGALCRAFVTDCDLVFTKPYLEKSPLEEVPLKPDELLFPTRFVRRAGRGERGGAAPVLGMCDA